MTDEQLDKRYLCKNELTALIRFVTNKQITAKYIVEDDGEEFVDLINPDGVACRRICVGGDSLLALARDVLRRI